jgi:hypothetical protein
MGGTGGFPPNFFYFTFIIEYYIYGVPVKGAGDGRCGRDMIAVAASKTLLGLQRTSDCFVKPNPKP